MKRRKALLALNILLLTSHWPILNHIVVFVSELVQTKKKKKTGILLLKKIGKTNTRMQLAGSDTFVLFAALYLRPGQ